MTSVSMHIVYVYGGVMRLCVRNLCTGVSIRMDVGELLAGGHELEEESSRHDVS